MFVHNINPVILRIGFLEIRYYGLVYVFGFALTYYLLRKNKERFGLSEKSLDDFFMYIFLGAIVGSRLFHFLFSEPLTLIRNPLEFFMIWHGGMSFFGGLIFTSLAAYIFTRKHRLDFYKLADFIVFPFTIALILGRIANFINAEIVGTITNVPWCFNFPGYMGCRHPYQLYASFSHLVLLGILLIARKIKQKGFLFWLFVTAYSGIRFITDFFRADPRFLALTVWQYFCIIGFIIGLLFINKLFRKSTK